MKYYICKNTKCEHYGRCPIDLKMPVICDLVRYFKDEKNGIKEFAYCKKMDYRVDGVKDPNVIYEYNSPKGSEDRAREENQTSEAAPRRLEVKWTDGLARRFEELERGLPEDMSKWTTLDHIDYVEFCSLDYCRVFIAWLPYLRGETDERPKVEPDPSGQIYEKGVGAWMVGTIEPTFLLSLRRVIERLPSLNTPDGGYPIRRLEQLFKTFMLLTTLLNYCEEEGRSPEGARFGCAAISSLKLRELVCPKQNSYGRYVLERKLIAEAFKTFYTDFCNAAWALSDKVEKRESGKIDLTCLDREIGQMKEENEDYQPESIELEILAALPETSLWQFVRACSALQRGLAKAIEHPDATLSLLPWFRWGLSILAKGPLADRPEGYDDLEDAKVDIIEGLRDIFKGLRDWAKVMFQACATFDSLQEVIYSDLTTQLIEAMCEVGGLDRFIEGKVFRTTPDGEVVYDGTIFAKHLAATHGGKLEQEDLPEDVRYLVNTYSTYFFEENDMGWEDEDRDDFLKKAVAVIKEIRRKPSEKLGKLTDENKRIIDCRFAETGEHRPLKPGTSRPANGSQKIIWNPQLEREFRRLDRLSHAEHKDLSYDNLCDIIERNILFCLKIITRWTPYIRGESDERPPALYADKKAVNPGAWMTYAANFRFGDDLRGLFNDFNSLEKLKTELDEGGFPADRLPDLFSKFQLLIAAMEGCDPEPYSTLRTPIQTFRGQCKDLEDVAEAIIRQARGDKSASCKMTIGEAYIAFCGGLSFSCDALDKICAARDSGEIGDGKIAEDLRSYGQISESSTTSPRLISEHALEQYFSKHPVSAVVTGFSKEGGKSLRTEMKGKGGPTARPLGAPPKLTQKKIAELFGSPCTEDVVANWEAYERSGGKDGTPPPSAQYNGTTYLYSQALRLNPTRENTKILYRIASRYWETRGTNDGISIANTIHAMSEEKFNLMLRKFGVRD